MHYWALTAVDSVSTIVFESSALIVSERYILVLGGYCFCAHLNFVFSMWKHCIFMFKGWKKQWFWNRRNGSYTCGMCGALYHFDRVNVLVHQLCVLHRFILLACWFLCVCINNMCVCGVWEYLSVPCVCKRVCCTYGRFASQWNGRGRWQQQPNHGIQTVSRCISDG